MECIKEIQDGYEIILSKRLYEREAIISLAYKNTVAVLQYHLIQ